MDFDETFLPSKPSIIDRGADQIQVAGFQGCSFVAGPGRRCVVWVSGCHRRCPGCFQPQFFSFDAGDCVSVDELANRILQLPELDGLTISGGEPFEQSAAVTSLCKLLRETAPGLSILAYTGYRIENLNKESRFVELLNCLDILIDGEFREELAGPFLWRGSSNQRVIFRNKDSNEWHFEFDDLEATSEDIQVALTQSELTVTGFPDGMFQRVFAERLESRGILLKQKRQ